MTGPAGGDVVLALDAGTHAVRTLTFDVDTGAATRCAEADLPLRHPQPGRVEIDTTMLADASVRVLREAVSWAAEQGQTVAERHEHARDDDRVEPQYRPAALRRRDVDVAPERADRPALATPASTR